MNINNLSCLLVIMYNLMFRYKQTTFNQYGLIFFVSLVHVYVYSKRMRKGSHSKVETDFSEIKE